MEKTNKNLIIRHLKSAPNSALQTSKKYQFQNEGFNRFTCFACDFTLCLTCAHANMQHAPMPTGEIPDAHSNPAAAGTIHL